MKGYLGEKEIDVSKSKYADFTQQDWAIFWIEKYAGFDGSHHKDWCLDQVARILKGARVIVKIAKWENGHKEYRLGIDKPPKEYWDWVAEVKNGEDGPNTYDYKFGTPP